MTDSIYPLDTPYEYVYETSPGVYQYTDETENYSVKLFSSSVDAYAELLQYVKWLTGDE